MKKLSIVALALAAAMLFAIPAMAVDLSVSGHYRVRGFYEDNTDLNDKEGASDAALDMRLRLEPVIKVHDNLKLTMRFDGQDNRMWGDNLDVRGNGLTAGTATDTDAAGDDNSYNGTYSSREDFGLERVYLDATFDMIGLRVGRMSAGTCGLKFCDSDTDADRIKVILRNIDPFYLDFTYQKSTEDDYNSGSDTDTADQDSDAYWIHGFSSDEAMTYGLLFGYYRDATASNPATTGYKREYWLFDPYFKGTFGPVAVEAEAQWYTGEHRDYYTAGAGSNRDYDAWRYIIDAAFNFGPGSVGVGYAHADGQENTVVGTEDYTIPSDGLGGNDWEPFVILTSYSANSGLGGVGNFNSANATTAVKELGFDIFYLYGSYVPMEKLTLTAIVGMATADETNTPTFAGSNLDDEIGWEFDLGGKYQLMDNLTYDVKLGFFQAGDLYKAGVPTANVDDTWAIMHSLVLTF
jgi:hypothetical protein